MTNQAEEDSEIKHILEKVGTKSQTQATSTTQRKGTGSKASPITYYDSEDDGNRKFSANRRNPPEDSDDELDEEMVNRPTTLARSGRGRAAASGVTRGGRGRGSRGGGRGASKQTQPTIVSQFQASNPKKVSSFVNSDDDVIEDVPKKTQSDYFSSFTASKNQPLKSLPVVTTQSNKKHRIEYMDDDDETGDLEYVENKLPSSKKSKTGISYDNDDEDDAGETTNAFSIFKKSVNKK